MDNINIDIIENIEDVSVAITEIVEEISIVTTGTRGDQGVQGIQGIQGVSGCGVPISGSTGQVLTKISGSNYDTSWQTPVQYVYVAGTPDDWPTPYQTNTMYIDDDLKLTYVWNGTAFVCTGGLGNIPAGLNKEVQFNDNGVKGSDANFLFDNVTKSLVIGKATLLPSNPLGIGGDLDTYLQVNIQNKSNGIHASSDYICTADNGSDTTNYIDMGINNSMFDDPAFPYAEADDGYLVAVGGDLALVATDEGKEIKIYAGSQDIKTATINGSGIILETGNTYKIGSFDVTDLIVSVSGSQAEADAFARGSKLVIREDLL